MPYDLHNNRTLIAGRWLCWDEQHATDAYARGFSRTGALGRWVDGDHVVVTGRADVLPKNDAGKVLKHQIRCHVDAAALTAGSVVRS